MNEEMKQPPLAGAEIVKDADVNMPPSEKETCEHKFGLEKIVLHKKTLFGNEELLASVVYCVKCGHLGSSSRITF